MDALQSTFGRLAIRLLKSLALPSLRHLFQIALISMSVADLLTGLLKSVNFVYWRYFRGFRYVLALIGVLLHYNINIDFGDIPWINVVVFYYCASQVAVYLVDFAWMAGQELYDQQPLANKVIALGFLAAVLGLLIAKTVQVRIEVLYVGYLVLLVVLGWVSPKGRLASGLMVAIMAHMQRLANQLWEEYWIVSAIIMAVLLAIAYDRQGK